MSNSKIFTSTVDPFGDAMWDFFKSKIKKNNSNLWVHNKYFESELYPVKYFFRLESNLNDLEKIALDLCKGDVLDVGAGTGVHSHILQKRKYNVKALENSEKCAKIMRIQGVLNIENADFYDFDAKEKYDTLLFLMNGIGIAESINNFSFFLEKCYNLLNKNGQIICDSSDIAYLYQDDFFPTKGYYGETRFQWEYKSQKSDWFPWLYLDKIYLQELCEKENWLCEIIYDDGNNAFLFRLMPK